MPRGHAHTDADEGASLCAAARERRRRLEVRVVRRTDGANGIPMLAPNFGFAGLEVGEVRLVVGVDAGHQLDVGRVFAVGVGVGEVAVPRVAELLVAPRPLFLAGGNVVVRHVNETGLRGVIVAAEEILARTHAHVGGGDGNVRIPRKIVGCAPDGGRIATGPLGGRHPVTRAGTVVDPVVSPRRARERAHRPLGVIGDVGGIGREKRLVVPVDAGRDIRPPQKRLHVGRAVVGADLHLEQRATGVETDPVHPFHAGEGIVFREPHRHRAVGVVLDGDIGRHERRRPMVLRPVELDPSAHPRSGQADQRGFDDGLVVNEIEAVGLVRRPMDASAEFGENHHGQKFVLDINRVPHPRRGALRNSVGERQRVDASAGALIDAFLQKHRIAVGRERLVGRQHERCAADSDGSGLHETVPAARQSRPGGTNAKPRRSPTERERCATPARGKRLAAAMPPKNLSPAN